MDKETMLLQLTSRELPSLPVVGETCSWTILKIFGCHCILTISLMITFIHLLVLNLSLFYTQNSEMRFTSSLLVKFIISTNIFWDHLIITCSLFSSFLRTQHDCNFSFCISLPFKVIIFENNVVHKFTKVDIPQKSIYIQGLYWWQERLPI